jgi:DNA-binding response OmpR family regulator
MFAIMTTGAPTAVPLRLRQRTRKAPLTALIVEDGLEASFHASRLLAEMGYACLWRASSVKRALSFCSATPFDLALVQLDLRGEDGANLIYALRAWPGSVDRIVAVSLDSGRLQRAAHAKMPADGFVRMPLALSTLQACLGPRQEVERLGLDLNEPVHVIDA